jgi:hypothetical protein
MMQDHIVKAVLSQGSTAIGQFVRWWLLALVCSVAALTWYGMQDGTGLILAVATAVVLTATMVALPAAAVVAIVFVAVKF